MRSIVSIWLLIFLGLTVFAQEGKKVVILHTNDIHSQIEPLSKNSPDYPDNGGLARQSAFVDAVRAENPIVFVFNSGDIVQGTPYFNFFKGEAEIALMNAIRYDAATLGNHEFDYGLEILGEIVRKADFLFVVSNYDFSETIVKGLTKEYLVLEKEGVRIGVLGVSVNPKGSILENHYAGMRYSDPVEAANRVAQQLKENEDCDIVVCLSHLGYSPESSEVNDVILARQSRNIDIILGGHSHTFMEQPDRIINRDGQEVVISQMGKNGVFVGRLDITLQEE